jgi:hypothetical protein
MADSNTVSYQGVLRDAAISPVANGGYAMEFSIYDADMGGTAVWGPEAYASVAVTNGVFSVYLGSIEPLGSLFADHAMLWLEISADTGAGMETYAPRVPLASVPYAQHALHAATAGQAGNADNLGGQPPSAYAESGHTHAGADITTGTVSTDRLNVGPASNQVAPGNHTHTLNALSDVNASGPITGQSLTWNGSDWRAAGGYAVIRDVKPAGVQGGASVADWQTRDLTQIDTNIPGATLSNNDFTLPAGRYRISASAPAYAITYHQLGLFNVNSNAFQIAGTSEYMNATSGVAQTRSMLEGHLVLSSPTTFRLRHYTGNVRATNGLGVRNAGSAEIDEVYSIVVVHRY